MNLSRLEKATRLMEKMREVDAEIVKFEALAEQISSKPSKIKISLNVEDLSPKKEEILNSDGDLIKSSGTTSAGLGLWTGYLSGMRGILTPKEFKENSDTLDYEISDTTALRIIGVLLAEKQEIREAIFREFKRIGVEV